MSMNKHYYVIAGCDLTKFRSEKYEDWKWTEEGESFTCNQIKGNIQLFDDPMDSSYLYLGYILASGDEYYFDTTKIDLREASKQQPFVHSKLKQLIDNNVITDVFLSDLKYEIIVFEECT